MTTRRPGLSCGLSHGLPLGLVLLTLAACDSGTSSRAMVVHAPRAPAPIIVADASADPAVPADAPASGDAVSPVSDRDRLRKEAFEAAIRGLTFENGLVLVDPLPALVPDEARQHFNRGTTLLNENRRTEALGEFTLAVRKAPGAVDYYMGLGEAFITKGKSDMAAAVYRTATQVDTNAIEAHVELAMALARQGRSDEAIDAMQGALEIDPDFGVAHERLAIWRYYEEDFATAWEHVNHARRVGQPVPEQFLRLLAGRSPEP